MNKFINKFAASALAAGLLFQALAISGPAAAATPTIANVTAQTLPLDYVAAAAPRSRYYRHR